ncbi:MAG: sigma-70 family RNA polymerase sigma factor [Planctomycetaceae bacterium]
MADAADKSDLVAESSEQMTPGEDFIREFTQSQRRLFLYILPLVGNPSDADEVLQETNLVIWRKWRQFEPGSNFLAWGRTIARFEYLRFRRSHNSKLAFVSENILELIAERAETISDETELRQQALAKCLDQLRAKDRELIQMRYATDTNGDQVAHQLGRPPNSVYQSLGRIRRTLMECIQHRMAESRLIEDGGLS